MKFRFRPIGLANTQRRLFMKKEEYSDAEGNRNRIKWTLWVFMGVNSCYFWVWELVACFWDISINRPQIGLAGLEWRSRPKISDKFKWSKHTVRILFVSMHPREIPPINGMAALCVYVSRAGDLFIRLSREIIFKPVLSSKCRTWSRSWIPRMCLLSRISSNLWKVATWSIKSKLKSKEDLVMDILIDQFRLQNVKKNIFSHTNFIAHKKNLNL